MPAQLSQKPGSSLDLSSRLPKPYPTGGGLRAAAGVFWLRVQSLSDFQGGHKQGVVASRRCPGF